MAIKWEPVRYEVEVQGFRLRVQRRAPDGAYPGEWYWTAQGGSDATAWLDEHGNAPTLEEAKSCALATCRSACRDVIERCAKGEKAARELLSRIEAASVS